MYLEVDLWSPIRDYLVEFYDEFCFSRFLIIGLYRRFSIDSSSLSKVLFDSNENIAIFKTDNIVKK